MTLTLRILLGFLVVGGLCGYFFLNRILQRVERQYLEAAEDPMVDAANLLAGMVAADWGMLAANGEAVETIPPAWMRGVAEAARRNPEAQIYTKLKQQVDMDFYLADAQGRVIFDTSGRYPPGTDLSSRLDVFQTLHGRYGARSTRLIDEDSTSSVMYVGAPVTVGKETVGVLSVFKPQRSMREFVHETQRELRWLGLLALLALVGGAALVSRWITFPIRQLTGYVEAVARGEKPARPKFASKSMAELARAFEDLRDSLQSRDSMEAYVQSLSHEMKSPLAAIRGASELLIEDGVPEDRRRQFLGNIQTEAQRLEHLIASLLALSSMEKRKELHEAQNIDLAALTRSILDKHRPVWEARGLRIEQNFPSGTAKLPGDPYLLRIALENLLQNAVEFSPPNGCIRMRLCTKDGEDGWELTVEDDGPGVPEYAMGKVFDRFYSLPRPDTGKKSSGLGLCLAREAVVLHGGRLHLENRKPQGARAVLWLPG